MLHSCPVELFLNTALFKIVLEAKFFGLPHILKLCLGLGLGLGLARPRNIVKYFTIFILYFTNIVKYFNFIVHCCCGRHILLS